MAGERILTGDKEIDRKLKFLERRAANRAARAGLAAGGRVLVKAIKQEVPSHLRTVKKAFGSRVKKDKRAGVTQAKAGAAVGKRPRGKPAKRSSAAGVGISRRNIHWWILGTGPRTQKKTGRATGRMPQHPVVKTALAKTRPDVVRKIAETVNIQLLRLAAQA